MSLERGWICEPEDAPLGSWMSDAPWFKANHRHAHHFLVCHRNGVSNCLDPLAWVVRSDLDRQLFYGDPIGTPGEMSGLAARYCTLDRGAAQNAVCVIDAGGVGPVLTSAWLIAWGPGRIYMATVDGSPPAAGISEVALVVADWRYAVRVANIAPASCMDLTSLLSRALVMLPARLKDPEKVRATYYLNQRLRMRLPTNLHCGIFVRDAPLRDDERRVVGALAEAV